MMISDYRLEQNLPYDLTRPVAEMAAFFDILPQSDSTDVLKSCRKLMAAWRFCETEDGTRRVSRPFTILQDVRGEWVRCAKLAVLDVLRQAVRCSLVMPWGILTGVRPGKLAHKLLDSGLSCDELPQYLERHYLLPHGQAQLLTEIACGKDSFYRLRKSRSHLYRYSFLPYALFLLFFSIGNCAA